jgi:8-oxo-dGTP diphosphatase
MKTHTAGFIFDHTLENVLLIHKLRPEWQNGKLNGIGGKIEPGESSLDCIVREIKEETDLTTEKNKWIYAGKNTAPEWSVDFYAYHLTNSSYIPTSVTDEKVGWYSLSNLPSNLIPNLEWLIPLAKNKLTKDEYGEFSVTYTK